MIEIKDKQIYFFNINKRDVIPVSFECMSAYVCQHCKKVLAAYYAGVIPDIEPFLEDNSLKYHYTLGTSDGGQYFLLDNHHHKKGCPECNRSLSKGACADHGRVEGVYDLRIKGVIDNGATSQDIVLNRDLTEKLTGMTLEKAKEIATEALDTATVADEMKIMLVGRYFEVVGVAIDKNLIVESIKPYRPELMNQVDALLVSVEA